MKPLPSFLSDISRQSLTKRLLTDGNQRSILHPVLRRHWRAHGRARWRRLYIGQQSDQEKTQRILAARMRVSRRRENIGEGALGRAHHRRQQHGRLRRRTEGQRSLEAIVGHRHGFRARLVRGAEVPDQNPSVAHEQGEARLGHGTRDKAAHIVRLAEAQRVRLAPVLVHDVPRALVALRRRLGNVWSVRHLSSAAHRDAAVVVQRVDDVALRARDDRVHERRAVAFEVDGADRLVDVRVDEEDFPREDQEDEVTARGVVHQLKTLAQWYIHFFDPENSYNKKNVYLYDTRISYT